jgi:hypothetical protein
MSQLGIYRQQGGDSIDDEELMIMSTFPDINKGNEVELLVRVIIYRTKDRQKYLPGDVIEKITPQYPTLQVLTTSEIPTKPTAPACTTLVAPTSITNRAGLEAITGSNHYTIDADIDLTAGGDWTPLAGFSGVIEGNGYTISNMNINSPASDDQGFFVELQDNACICNLNFDSCSVVGQDNVGILAAHIGYSTKRKDIIIKNVNITNSTVEGGYYTGGFVGYIWSDGNIQVFNCAVDGCTITLDDDSSSLGGGGFIGWYDGGSTMYADDYWVDCYVSDTEIVNSNDSDYNYLGGFIGGLFGNDSSLPYKVKFHSCYIDSSSSITLTNTVDDNVEFDWVGGFAGWADLVELVSCYSEASISATEVGEDGDAFACLGWGGFAGAIGNGYDFIDCYSTGSINLILPGADSNATYLGGFVGMLIPDNDPTYSLDLLRCYSTGNIIVDFTTSGRDDQYIHGNSGFIGYLDGPNSGTCYLTIDRCYTHSNISYPGGFSGGRIQADGNNIGGVGGFIGEYEDDVTDAVIENCYTWSSITASGLLSGSAPVGGFLGLLDKYGAAREPLSDITFENCYSAQTIEAQGSGLTDQLFDAGTDEVGGFLGVRRDIPNPGDYDAVCTLCFWDTETSGTTEDDSDGAVGKATTEMQIQETYSGWDFDTIWEME